MYESNIHSFIREYRSAQCIHLERVVLALAFAISHKTHTGRLCLPEVGRESDPYVTRCRQSSMHVIINGRLLLS